MKTIETRVLDTLHPHPRNSALYGNDHEAYDDKLVESLVAGIWPGEIQITTGNVIISGHRRCEHAIFANIESAEVWVRSDLPEDPTSPQVLEALLQANLQRNKSNEQKLREFALWKEVERDLAKGRKLSGKGAEEPSGENHRMVKTGDARDLAAKRVGIGSGSDAEKAHKALLAADQAEATGDVDQIAKAKEVKQALDKGISAATRKAQEVGLIEKPKPRAKKTKGKPTTPTPAPTPTPSAPPAPTPAPNPSVPSVGSSAPARWEDDPVLDGWNGNLNELGQQIYNREVASSRKRMQMAEQMAEFKLLLEKTMRAASKNHAIKAGRLLEVDVKMVEATLQREGRPGIKQTLEAVLKEADRIQKYASETLRLLQLT